MNLLKDIYLKKKTWLLGIKKPTHLIDEIVMMGTSPVKAMKAPEPWEASAAAWALGRLLDVNPAAMPDEAQVWLGWVAWVGWDGWDAVCFVIITYY